MYIKELHIDGFKSYGRRIEIKGFDNKFNAITGLNGSGKSNILDAICFVLGISNLSHVRAHSLQELIFKNGQTGVTTATVTIIFDNSEKNSSPPNYEKEKDLVITRQISIGGKNKYLINGATVTAKAVQDFFCSVSLNVNNPHFLIMQGKVTKVLNMKPKEILAMVQEAAGTSMYDTKRALTLRTIEKKNGKLDEIHSLINDTLRPKLVKLKAEHKSYLQYLDSAQALQVLQKQYQAYEYCDSQRRVTDTLEQLDLAKTEMARLENIIKEGEKRKEEIQQEIEQLQQCFTMETQNELQELQEQLQAKNKKHANLKELLALNKAEGETEQDILKNIEKSIGTDQGTLEKKQEELKVVEKYYQSLDDEYEHNNNLHELAKKKLDTLCYGLEIDEHGQAQSLQMQLTTVTSEAAAKKTEVTTLKAQLAHAQECYNSKKSNITAGNKEYARMEHEYKALRKDLDRLEASQAKLNFSKENYGQVQQECESLKSHLRNELQRFQTFCARYPWINFSYTDPVPNFDRSQVYGVACRLFTVKDPKYYTAIDSSAGGKLFNVICKDEKVGVQLLDKGKLQYRTTFLPLTKLRGSRIPQRVVQFAQGLVGADNVIPAMDLINYNPELETAMQYIFGNVLICADMDIAKRVAFHPQIMTRCVTLIGDVADPGGTMSGGAINKSGSTYAQIVEYLKTDEVKRQLGQVERRRKEMEAVYAEYQALHHQIAMKTVEVESAQKLLTMTEYHSDVESCKNLEVRIQDLKTAIAEAEIAVKQCTAKIKEIEANQKDSTGYHDRQLKQAQQEMKQTKADTEGSREKLYKCKADMDSLKYEINELQTGSLQNGDKVNNINIQLEKISTERNRLSAEIAKLDDETNVVLTAYNSLNDKMSGTKNQIAKCNELEDATNSKINKAKLEAQKQNHIIDRLSHDLKKLKQRNVELAKNADSISESDMAKAQGMSDSAARELQMKIKQLHDNNVKVSRTLNLNAQQMYEHEEKQYDMIIKRRDIIDRDKSSLIKLVEDLDRKKLQAIEIAYNRVKTDFNAIFGTLLTGATATLKPAHPDRSILEGLEIKVTLGGISKDNLSELSGGQRSLAALALILAMLVFKPAPLYILDEVDAALDLSHTQNIGLMLKNYFKQSQFIVVSLKDGMFSNADVLFRTQYIDGLSSITRTVNKTTVVEEKKK